MFLAPIVFLLLTSFMSNEQTADLRHVAAHLASRELLSLSSSGRHCRSYLLNTVIYAVFATGFMLLASVPAAYALSKLKWRGRNATFVAIICVMMLPPQVVTVPLYLMWASFGLTGSLWPLILPMLAGDAFSIFLLRQFLVTIPDEYLDAARVDGCGEWRTLLRVVMPMAKPGIAAAALFQFFYAGTTTTARCSTRARTRDRGRCRSGWRPSARCTTWTGTWSTAATMLTLIPVVVLFFFAQKAFVQGVTLTGVKG